MSRVVNYNFLRRLSAYFYLRKGTAITSKPNFVKTKLLVGSQLCCAILKNETNNKIDVDDGLRKACEEGDEAILRLMDQLQVFVTVVSREYRSCLNKQIEITEKASHVGPMSDVWDELPAYRTLADELSKELSDYRMLFNTIGQMADEQSLVEFVTGNKDSLDLVGVKYKELEVLLQKEFDENKKIEMKLLEIKRDSILKGL